MIWEDDDQDFDLDDEKLAELLNQYENGDGEPFAEWLEFCGDPALCERFKEARESFDLLRACSRQRFGTRVGQSV